MADRLILETTFLVDLERERQRGEEGACASFLRRHSRLGLVLTHITAGELACVYGPYEQDAWARYLAPFFVLRHTLDVDWHYAQTYRYLKSRGELPGANDLWIAASGLAYRLPVVTRNVDHYRRVPALEVMAY